MLKITQANTIDEVLSSLDHIIAYSKKENDPKGYFAALYRKVTFQVKKGIEDGVFENGPRMEKLDVVFANRYLEAYTAYQSNEPLSECWEVAFKGTEKFWPIVLQHLFAGMNAHINLDLGIAAVEISPGSEIMSLKNDFFKINTILNSLVNEVETELAKIWPLLKYIDKLMGKRDEQLAKFSMGKARDAAWEFAVELAEQNEKTELDLINKQDIKMADFGHELLYPPIFAFVPRIIRITEKYNVSKRIEILQ